MAKAAARSRAARRDPEGPDFLGGHWRAPFAGLVGAAAGAACSFGGLKPGASALLGWDVAAITFLLTVGWIVLRDDEQDLRRRACVEDEPPAVMTLLVVSAISFGFAAIVIAMREAASGGPGKGGHGGGLVLGVIAIATLMLSWLAVQALFTLHYAHRYFGDADGAKSAGEGFTITGDKPSTYRDFLYMAVCIGACFQVSDFGPTNTSFRNLITIHALISFAFNALVIALGVGIVGDLLKG